MFVNSTLDWRSYINNKSSNFEHHLLKPISTKNSVYLSINPKYRKLPTIKIDAECPSIFLKLSDQRIIELFQFFTSLQLPKFAENETFKAAAPTITTRTNATSATTVTAKSTNRMPQSVRKSKQQETIGTIEPDDAWEGAFRLPTDINGNPIANYPKMSFKFEISAFTIELNANASREYLRLTLDTITLHLAVTKFGMCIKSSLKDLVLVDQPNRTQILSSACDNEILIKFYLRLVEREAPNFGTLYKSTLTAIKLDFNAIQVR